MTDPADRTRKTWWIAGTVVSLALALIWLSAWVAPSPDDPAVLLRQAAAAKTASTLKPTGKVVVGQGTSASGTPVQVRMPEFADKSGNRGYAVHLSEPLKPGVPATIKMPGGGVVTVGIPKDGEAPVPPGTPTPRKPAAR